MLNVGAWELMIILLVALVFLGPRQLPTVARQIGQTVSTLRGLATSFQAELEAAARPDPLAPATVAGTDSGASDAGSDIGSALSQSAGDRNEALTAKAREIGDRTEGDGDAVRQVSDGGPSTVGDTGHSDDAE